MGVGRVYEGGQEETRGGKRRKVRREEEVEEAEVEEVVFVPSVKANRNR